MTSVLGKPSGPDACSWHDKIGDEHSLLQTAVLSSIVYGVTEEVVRYLSWRAGRAMRDNRTSDWALVAGLAWGGAECAAVHPVDRGRRGGGVPRARLLPDRHPAAVLTVVSLGSVLGFVPGRLFVIAGHVAFAHLSVLAHRRSAAFLALAIAAHVVFDASVFGVRAVLGPQRTWPTVLFAVLAFAAVVWLRRSWVDRSSGERGTRTWEDAPAVHSS